MKFISGAALLCSVASGAMQIRFGCRHIGLKFKCCVAYKIWINIPEIDFWVGALGVAFDRKFISGSEF